MPTGGRSATSTARTSREDTRDEARRIAANIAKLPDQAGTGARAA